MNEHQQVTNPDIPPSATMLRMISGFRVARAIYIAAKLGLADLLKDGPKGARSWRPPPEHTHRHCTESYVRSRV